MSLSIITIADALVTLLNKPGEFSQPLNAVRKYVPEYELKDTGVLRTTVALKSRNREPDGRGYDKIDRELMIAVQKRAGTPQAIEAECDTLVKLVEEIEDWLADEEREQITIAGVTVALGKATVDPIYSPSQLRRMNQFTSGILLPVWTLE